MSHRIAVERLSVRYEGLAVESHRMDVRQLAPSLLALDDLFAYAHFLTGDGHSHAPAMEVAALQQGSFVIGLSLTSELGGGRVADLFDEHAPAARAAALCASVVAAMRWAVLRQRKGREDQVVPVEPQRVRVVWPDGTHLEAPRGAQILV